MVCKLLHEYKRFFLITGVSYSGQKNMDLSYVIGKVSFIDTPSVYKAGMTLEGKVSKYKNLFDFIQWSFLRPSPAQS